MEKTITLTLEQAKEIYKEGGKDIKELLLTTFAKDELENTYPKTWKECVESYNQIYYIDVVSAIMVACPEDIFLGEALNSLPSREMAENILTICQLLICRDVYRKGWKSSKEGYCITFDEDNHAAKVFYTTFPDSHLLSFQTEEVAKEFLRNFGNLITLKIKEFL